MTEIARLLRFVRPYRLKTFLSLVLLIIVVVLDLAIPRLVQHIIDQGILASNLEAVWHTFLWMLAISVTNTLFAVGNNAYSVQVAESVARDLRAALFLKVQSLSFGNLDRLQTGQLMVRLSSDSASIQRVVQIFLRIGTRAPLLMIGSIVLMFTTDRELALLMVPLLLATFGFIILFVTKMRPLFMTMQRKLDRLNTILQENIAGARVVKAFVRADHETGRFEFSNEDFTERNIRVIEGLATIGPALVACINIGLVVVIWAGGWQAVRGDVTTGQLVAFINYLQTALVPLLVTAMLANVWAAGSASAERLNEVLDDDPDVRDAPDARDLPKPGVPRITFEQVGFRYDLSTNSTVLEDVTLTVAPGQTVAVLGATGAGKSTLVHLIPRFYDATEGRVLFDGTDVRQLRQDALRARIGVVPQETVLFSGTIRDTIGYGNPHASDEDVVAAARAAQAHDFILALPHGYDTRVEARGVNLSGGQKQRLAIARALLTRPDILILDDSTSAVDVETETKIQAAIQTWMQGGTCFVVAQRISTVLTADKIVVLDRGRVAAQGTHRRLLKSSPIYREIYMSQLGDGPIEAE